MKIGLCSDSHDNLPNLEKAVSLFRNQGVETILHCGDFVAPFTVEVLRKAGCPVYGIFGNCDGERQGLKEKFTEIGEIFSEPHLFTFDKFRVVAMHHPHWVEAFANRELADLVVYGHLHKLSVENRPPWIINPGEVFGRLSSGPTVVVFDTIRNEPDILHLDQFTILPEPEGSGK